MKEVGVEASLLGRGELRLAEIVSALSHALDLTDGQPAGHSVRCCWIGTHIGRVIGLSDAEMSDLYYTLLLKDLGCSSNAARICKLFVTSDHDFKRNVKLVDNSLPQLLRFVAANTAVRSGLKDRLQALLSIAMHGGSIDREVIETRCERGAEIARRMRFPEPVARGILDLDEHWDGRGQPLGLKGGAISLYARIALLAQVVDVFHNTAGSAAARREVRRRSGRWFDPRLVDAFEWAADDLSFWHSLEAPGLERRVFDLEPATRVQPVDEGLLDDIADGFAQVVDAKSPFTSGHSKRVALVAELIAGELGLDAAARRTLTRAALLHDIGKLGVTNQVLDKPGQLDEEEWAIMRRHPSMGEAILSRVGAFTGAATVAAGHHEKLSGGGYPRGLRGWEIDLPTRIVAVADIFDALTADRPYRAAMPTDQALAILRQEIGTALDGDCVRALEVSLARMAREAA
jgi:putative nucleotidyltransferase with HDIG domain